MTDKMSLRERLAEKAQARFDAAKEGREIDDGNVGATLDSDLLGDGVRSLEAPSATLNYQDDVDLKHLNDEDADQVNESRMTEPERRKRVRMFRRRFVRDQRSLAGPEEE